jgi:hypothetical protein
MKPQPDIWRTACALVAEHGPDARFAARVRADALLAQYDVDGHLVWKRIAKAIGELQRTERDAGEWLN